MKFTQQYYKQTQGLASSPLLIEALRFVEPKDKTALDLGCGAGRDTKLLLEMGFRVAAVDSEPLTKQYIENLYNQDNLTYYNSSFTDFNYHSYDIINAQYSLPFLSPKDFPFVIHAVLNSLIRGGVFVGQLFGVNDEWNVPASNMSFHTEGEARDLFHSLQIIKFEEKNEIGRLANGAKKHWHVFNIIARRQ